MINNYNKIKEFEIYLKFAKYSFNWILSTDEFKPLQGKIELNIESKLNRIGQEGYSYSAKIVLCLGNIINMWCKLIMKNIICILKMKLLK